MRGLGGVSIAVGIGLLAACGGTVEEDLSPPVEAAAGADRFGDLDGKLLIRFEDNPGASAEVCQPFAVFAVDTEEEAFPIQVNFVVNQASFSGAGFALREEGQEDVLSGMMVLNEAGHVALPCAEIEVQLEQFACKDPETYDPRDCPGLTVEGADMFAAFSGAD